MNFRTKVNETARRGFSPIIEKRKNPEFISVKYHNPCPQCGSEVYARIMDSKYQIVCKNCGFEHFREFPYYLGDEGTTELTARINWNADFLDSKLSAEALRVLDIHEGDYLISDSVEGDILFIAANTDEVDEFFQRTDFETYYNVYVIKDGKPTSVSEEQNNSY